MLDSSLEPSYHLSKNLLLLLWILKLIVDMVNNSTLLKKSLNVQKEPTIHSTVTSLHTVLQMFVLCSLKTLSLC